MESKHSLYKMIKKLLVRLDRFAAELEPEIAKDPITLDSHIRILDLSVKSYNCLINSNIKTVGDLIEKSDEDLLAIKNLGKKCVREIRENLKDNGLTKDISSGNSINE